MDTAKVREVCFQTAMLKIYNSYFALWKLYKFISPLKTNPIQLRSLNSS